MGDPKPLVVPIEFSAPPISLKEFEEMVDSSLRIADEYKSDDQSIKGELSYIRECRWLYLPYRFRLAYRVLQGSLSVLFFMSQRAGERWKMVKTTDDYKAILRDADMTRRAAL
jgi:hypothetical protein